MSIREEFQKNDGANQKNTYDHVFSVIQSRVRDNYSELIANNDTLSISEQMTSIITRIINEEQLSVDGMNNVELAKAIYVDMAGASILEKYIYDIPQVEEVNINRWDDVTVTYAGGKPQKIPEQFSSPEQAVNIVRRLLRSRGLTIDTTKPDVLSYLSAGRRISANIYPVVSEDAAVSASIRIVRPENSNFSKLREHGTATEEMIEFLELCVKNHISICISGSVGAGKTTTLAAILDRVKYDDRIITIEEGSREFSLLKRDENGNILNNWVSKLTRESDNPKLVIDQEDLLEHCLRENPDIMGIGEMRSAEAYTVAEAARTGTATYTTTHAKNAPDTYKRLMELSYKKYPMELSFLMKQMIDAFPIIIHQKLLPDGSRKIVEIIEGTGYEPSTLKVNYNRLYEFVFDDNVENEDGEILEVKGHYQKGNSISDELYKTFLSNGATKKSLEKFYFKGGVKID